MDDSGNGKLIETDQLGKANRGLVVRTPPSPFLSLTNPLTLLCQGFTVDSFRHMCILSGCDYLASVPGIGLGKALKLMKRFNKDPYRVSPVCVCLLVYVCTIHLNDQTFCVLGSKSKLTTLDCV